MVNTEKVKHIFFDLDRTLWDYDSNVREALFDLFDLYVFDRVTSDAETFHRSFLFENGRLWEEYTANKIDKEYLRKNRFLFTIRRLGLTDVELALRLEEEYMRITPAKTNLLPGVHETLTDLAQRYELHILTNGFEDAQQFKLRNSGIRAYFSEVVTSDNAKATKPNKAIFDFSERTVKSLAHECVLVGDDLRADVEGALNAGWQAIHFHPNSDGKGVKSLPELLLYL